MNSITAWYNMTKPTRSTEIIGNVELVDSIKHFLDQKKTGQIILLKGPTGVGKTTCAKLLEERGYHVINVALSEIQNINELRNIIFNCQNSRGSILNWEKPKKYALLIDELECLPVHMKSILSELISIHNPKCNKKKKKKIIIKKDLPIVFICSKEYHRSLEEITKYAEIFTFAPPTFEEQYIWCETIASLSNNKVTSSILKFIINRSENDIRQLSNNMMSLIYEQNKGKTLIYIRKILRENALKETEKHLFTLLHETIIKPNNMNTIINNYQSESILLPWMVFENIYTYFPSQNDKFIISKIANIIAFCDYLWEFSHGQQVYEIEEYYAILSCWGIPNLYQQKVMQHLRKRIKPSFPSIMIKRSQMKLNQNYLQFLEENDLDHPDNISYASLILSSDDFNYIGDVAKKLNYDFIVVDRIKKLRGSYFSKWNNTFRKKIKKKIEE